MPPITIGIIGGGIAGLALGAALHKHEHLDVQIYETVRFYPDYGAGLAMHKNAIGALELLHPELKRAYLSRALSTIDNDQLEQATQIHISSGKNQGARVAGLGKAAGRKSIARYQLLQAFRELVPAERLHFEKKLVRVQQEAAVGDGAEHIALAFDDGTTAKVDCLIGADGVHSFVRRYLLGPEHPATASKNHDRWCLYPRTVPMANAQELVSRERLEQAFIACGPVGMVISMPMNRGTTLNVWFVQQSKDVRPGDEAFDKGRYADYDADVRAMAELVSRHTETPWILQDHDPAPFYNRRCVAIVGDAAHATLPFNGQGAAQALEDAAVLNVLLAKVKDVREISKAFAAFDSVRRARSQRVVEIARTFGRCYVLAQDGVGDDSQLIRQLLGPAGAFTNNVDLDEQNAAALRAFEALTAKS